MQTAAVRPMAFLVSCAVTNGRCRRSECHQIAHARQHHVYSTRANSKRRRLRSTVYAEPTCQHRDLKAHRASCLASWLALLFVGRAASAGLGCDRGCCCYCLRSFFALACGVQDEHLRHGVFTLPQGIVNTWWVPRKPACETAHKRQDTTHANFELPDQLTVDTI